MIFCCPFLPAFRRWKTIHPWIDSRCSSSRCFGCSWHMSDLSPFAGPRPRHAVLLFHFPTLHSSRPVVALSDSCLFVDSLPPGSSKVTWLLVVQSPKSPGKRDSNLLGRQEHSTLKTPSLRLWRRAKLRRARRRLLCSGILVRRAVLVSMSPVIFHFRLRVAGMGAWERALQT